jgi:hypothetical protein
MARKAQAKNHGKAFEPEIVHTIELAELFSMLRKSKVQGMGKNRIADEWNGDMNWNDAMTAAELGKWDAPKIEHLTIPTLEQESEDMRYFYDVTGNTLDVASYIAGEPEYWMVEEPIRKPCGRVIRIACEIGGLGDVEAYKLANRGQAIIALIHSLELQGHSIELTIVRAFTNANKDSYNFLIPIKHAGFALDVKRLQFMIGHPAFFRRVLFDLAEYAQGQDMHTLGTRTAYYAPQGYIHIRHDEGRMGTLEASMEWAKQFALTIAAEN